MKEVIDKLHHTLVERGASYADYADNAQIHVEIMTSLGMGPHYWERTKKPTWTEGALSQIASKMSRIAMPKGEEHVDNWLDIAGYAIIGAACRFRDANYPGSSLATIQRDTAAPSWAGEEPVRDHYTEPSAKGHGLTDAASISAAEPMYEEVKATQGNTFSWALDVMRHDTMPVRRLSWQENIYVWREVTTEEVTVLRRNEGFSAVVWRPYTADLFASDWVLHRSA